jgi:multidrug/hemolysin transport system permease protein
MSMLSFTERNLKVFFRDRLSVFFSLLAVFITIGLYVLFLGDMMQSNVGPTPQARFVADSWIMAGLLAMVAVTATMSALGTMVEDRSRKLLRDFRASPLKRSTLVGGYMLGALVVGLVLSLLTFVLGQLYIVVYGGEFLSLGSTVKVLAIMLLNVASSTAMMIFMVSFFSSTNAYGAAASILGALIGFLTGIYVPIGILPTGVQYAVKLFPPAHGAALFRQVMMEDALALAFVGAPIDVVTSFKRSMGVVFEYGAFTADTTTHVLVLLGSTAVFFALAVWNLTRKS